jgi:iron complex outermembrane recepter protein
VRVGSSASRGTLLAARERDWQPNQTREHALREKTHVAVQACSDMAMGPRRLSSIPGILLRTTVLIAPVLCPVCANAAEEQATALATQELPPKPETTTTSSESASSSSQRTTRSEQLEQVVVTGTYIRGVSPASPVITITSVDIENSGASTAGEVLRQLPESFAGGQQSTIGTNGQGPFQNLINLNYSDSANLRGFGSDSNLVLINGHRVPVTGIQNSVDISAIPLPAIDRVEVVTDGASALYGSDAVGGIVNFILKKEYAGAETRADFGIPTNGGGFSQRYGQLFGATWQGGSALISYQYRDQQGLYGSQRDWYTGPNPMSLNGSIHQNSIFFDSSQQVNSNLRVFAEGLYNRTTSFGVSTYAPSAPTDDLNTVGYTYNATVGASLTLPHDWRVDFTGTTGSDRFDYLDTEPCCDYAAHVVPANRMSEGEILSEGPVISIPSGDVRAAIGAGYRSEGLDSLGDVLRVTADRRIKYGLVDVTIPLIGAQTARKGAQELGLTFAGRYEDYSDVGTHFNPQVGLSYKPLQALRLRGTWSTSFHAPSLYQKYSSYFAQQLFVEAPAGGSTLAIATGGGNSAIQPETAKSFTLGADYQPPGIRTLLISANYFNIHYSDRITQPITDITTTLIDPAYASLVTPNPSPALQQSVISGANVFYNFTGAPYNPALITALIDNRYLNVSEQWARGIDIRFKFSLDSDWGQFTPFLNGSYLQLRQKLTATSPELTISGLVFYPQKYKIQGGLNWSRSSLAGTAIFNYVPPENNNLLVSPEQIGCWATLDLQGSYSIVRAHSMFDGISFRLSVLNVLDKRPAYLAGSLLGYDPTQASPLGRVVKIGLVKEW